MGLFPMLGNTEKDPFLKIGTNLKSSSFGWVLELYGQWIWDLPSTLGQVH